jgi:hypothetical protein
MNDFINVKPLWGCIQNVLPQVYDDTLGYQELLYKVISKLNALVENNNKLPDYIADLIREYISSGEIEKVLAEVLATYMLNVKFPPAGLEPASGDGSKDDTEAIQGCIEYAQSHGGMAVYFPSGSYLCDSLDIAGKCTMFGYDRYNTRIVLKGGATRPLLNGSVDEFSLNGLGFDGNMDIQVNNVNLIDITVGSGIITNVFVTDGYDLIKAQVDVDLQISDVVFNHAVENGLVVSGSGRVVVDSCVFRTVSALIGKSYVKFGVSNSTVSNCVMVGSCPVGVEITGNMNNIQFERGACVKSFVDSGTGNTVLVNGVEESVKLSNDSTVNVGGDVVRNYSGDARVNVQGDVSCVVAGNVVLESSMTKTDSVTGKRTVKSGSVDDSTSGARSVKSQSETRTVDDASIEVVGGDKNISAKSYHASVNGVSSENVQGNKGCTVVGDVTADYRKNENVTVGGNKTETVKGIWQETAEGNKIDGVNGNYERHVVGSGSDTVDGIANYTYKSGVIKNVTGGDTENVSGKKSVDANVVDITAGSYDRTINGNVNDNVSGEYTISFPDLTVDVKKLLSTFKDVTYYGAKGDGISDDTEAFTSSLRNQGCAIVPAGEFKTNVKLASNQTIFGVGEQSILKPFLSGTPVISTEKGSLGCAIQNLHIIGDNKSNGIFVDKGNGFVIDNVFIEECYNGILIEDKTPGYGRLTHISNTYVYNCQTAGILVSKHADISIINCECVSCSGVGQNQGYNCFISNGAFKMVNCHFWNQNDEVFGLYRPNASLRVVNCSDFEITNCHIEGGYTYNLIIDKSKGCIVNSLIYATFGAYSVRYDSENCYFIGCNFTGQAGDDVSYKPEFKAIFSNGDVATYTNFIGCSFNAKLVDKKCEFWQIIGCVNNDAADLVTILGPTSYVSCVGFNSDIRYTNIENMFTSQNVRLGNYSWLSSNTALTGNWYPGCKHYIYNGSGGEITITTNYKSVQTFVVESHKFICLIATDSAVQKLS